MNYRETKDFAVLRNIYKKLNKLRKVLLKFSKMNSNTTQDLQLLYEAVYNDDLRERATEYNETVMEENYINSVAENAAEYFYEMGLNEYGVDILAEELGDDEFMEFVYDVSDDYSLMEARRSGRIEPTTKTGKSVGSLKGGAKSAAIVRLRKEKAARRGAEERASEEKPSGMKAALRSQAMKSAEAKQPKTRTPEKDVKGAIGEFIKRGMERHRAAMGMAGETAKTAKKAIDTGMKAWERASDSRMAGQLRVAAKKGARRHETALKAAGGALGRLAGESEARRRAKAQMQSEDFEYWVNSLVQEGYDLSDYTWDDMYEFYLGEARGSDSPRRTFFPRSRERDIGRHDDWKDPHPDTRDFGERPEAGKKLKRRLQAVVGTRRREDEETGVRESYDLFDHILEHLISEGYTDSEEGALAIMANMSEEWKRGIIEAA
jgi:hypothetical protein